MPPLVKEPKIGLVQFAIPSGFGGFTLGGPYILMQAGHHYWYSVALAGTGVEAREHLMALEQKVFVFGQ